MTDFLEVAEEIGPVPTYVSKGFPGVVVGRCSAVEDHKVEGTATSYYFTEGDFDIAAR